MRGARMIFASRGGVAIGLPVGNLLVGAAAQRLGAPLAQGAYAAGAIAIMLAIILLVPSLRRLERVDAPPDRR
jgi:hypothetical protein